MYSKLLYPLLLTLALSSISFAQQHLSPPTRPPAPPPPSRPIPPAPAYGLQQFYILERDAVEWNRRFNAAPSGSFDERYAADQRDRAISSALNVIRDGHAFSYMSRVEIESFAEQMNQRFNAAASGSAIERFYSEATQIGLDSFNRTLEQDVRALSYDWRQLHQIALEMDQKFNAATSGSKKERAYDHARNTAFGMLTFSVQNELRRVYDFRMIEETALYFDQLFNAATSGSLKERTYDQIRRSAFQEAVARFQRNARQYDLYAIQEEYNRKFNSATSGSAKENYFRQIRDIARQLMGYR